MRQRAACRRRRRGRSPAPARRFGSAVGDVLEVDVGPEPAAAGAGRAAGATTSTKPTELWNQTLQRRTRRTRRPSRHDGDRRFAGQDWIDQPGGRLHGADVPAERAHAAAAGRAASQGDEKTQARIRFAVQQWIDAAAPSNYLALNPEAQRKALETKGESIAAGPAAAAGTTSSRATSRRPTRACSRSAATSPPPKARWCSRTSCSSCIEYKPLTAKVYERPMLFVPPCINKYYILDLQPENSLIRYTVEQGHRAVRRQLAQRRRAASPQRTWDDYIEDGADPRRSTWCRRSPASEQINTLGFCVGGTILATALAVLAARGEQPAASMTLLTTLPRLQRHRRARPLHRRGLGAACAR